MQKIYLVLIQIRKLFYLEQLVGQKIQEKDPISFEEALNILKDSFLKILKIDSNFSFWNSSAGRAPAWHAGGQGFKSPWLH